MITAILIDDELKVRSSLRQKLKDYCPHVHIIGEADNGIEGLKLILQLNPKVVFLDIEMPQMNGFEMLQQIHSKRFHLIFTTAYNQYALKAIKYAAFDYLLKPIDIEELKTAIQKVEEQELEVLSAEKLVTLMDSLSGKNPFQKIAVPTMEGLLFFEVSDIIYLEAEKNYSTLHFKNQPDQIASRTLGDFEELLPSNIFFRCHHSYLINLNYIKRYIKGNGGQIEMQNGHIVDLSRRRKEEFIKLTRT